MGLVLIEGTDVYYDDEYDIVLKEGKVRSTVPKGAFAYNGRLYTYGTKVKMKTNRIGKAECLAIFCKDEEEKSQITYSIPVKQAREYYGDNLELDDIFLPIDMDDKDRKYYKQRYYTTFDDFFEPTFILEVVEPVYYKAKKAKSGKIEQPPIDNGYKTIESKADSILGLRYRNHLWNCITDAAGNVETTFEPNTFGWGKYVYTTGTKVIIKHKNHISKTISYTVEEYNGNTFVNVANPEVYNYRDRNSNKIKQIISIVEPHYYSPEGHNITKWEKFKANGGTPPADTFAGTIWYIVIMVVGTIFKARWMIWIFATIVYLLWKYGYTNKK